jgi:hypothetical protein
MTDPATIIIDDQNLLVHSLQNALTVGKPGGWYHSLTAAKMDRCLYRRRTMVQSGDGHSNLKVSDYTFVYVQLLVVMLNPGASIIKRLESLILRPKGYYHAAQGVSSVLPVWGLWRPILHLGYPSCGRADPTWTQQRERHRD